MTRLTYPLLLLYLLIGGSRLPASPTANITHYFEACDGSAGVALDDRFFASAEDEHNTLRIYESHPPDGQKAEPVWDKNISDFLEVDKHEEGDLEAGARIGKLIFWIGSHGTDGEGVEQPARRRLFATEIVKGADGNFALQTHGQPYKHLLDDFFVDERLKKFDLEKAASAPTKSADGLNIEALCATPEDDLLIVAGPFDAAADFALYFWTGKLSDPAKKLAADLGELRPEGIIVYPGDPSRVQLLSDDGKQQPGGKKCKDMEKSERRLQSVWIDVPAL